MKIIYQNLSEIDEFTQVELFNFFATLSFLSKRLINEEKRKVFHMISKNIEYKNISASDLEILALLNLLYIVKKSKLNISKKAQLDANLQKLIDQIEVIEFRKKRISEKENWILNRSSIFIKLIKDNYSYKQMKKFVRIHHKKEISHETIRQTIIKYKDIFKKEDSL